MRTPEKPIEIATSTGTKSVSAEVCGNFAVHPSVGLQMIARGRWSVTHVPTGFVVVAVARKAQAREVAKACQKLWAHEVQKSTRVGTIEKWSKTPDGRATLVRCRVLPKEMEAKTREQP